jgi:uncharacterized metal-binding protein YceD (DUF177 family)
MNWSHILRLHELARGPITVALEPTAEERAVIARSLGLRSLPTLKADVVVKPWMDGAEVSGRYKAMVEQVCSLSLEPFHQPLEGEIFLRAVPAGSESAAEAGVGELELDLEAPDPPDVLDHDSIDLAAYVVEQLSLDVDPFPRKPGATFDFVQPAEELSPFAVLKKLNEPKA